MTNRWKRFAGLLALVLLLGVLAGPAQADVSNLTVDPSSPTNAAGGLTTYVITFNVSATGGLSKANNDTITISFPAGTDLTTVANTSLFDTTVAPDTRIGQCTWSGTVATCRLFAGRSIGGGDAVKVVINGVTNPGAGSKTLNVRTSAAADSMDVTSPPYDIDAANPITDLAVDGSDPTNAAGGRTSYVITFTTSATGGMSAQAGSGITVTFPSGTDPTRLGASQVYDMTVAPDTSIGDCSTNGTVVRCRLSTGQSIAAGHDVKLVINGITNPGAGSKTLDVSTTSDPSAVTSPSYSIVAAHQVSDVTVDPSDPTNAAEGRTSYVITFTTSATGGLSATANSQITLAFPTGTDTKNVVNAKVFDTTAAPGTPIGTCSGNHPMQCGLSTGERIAPGHDVKVVVNGVENPGAGSKTLDVSTTSDPSPVTSPSYSIVAANPVTDVTADPSDPTKAAGGRTNYVITFKTSATGGLSAAADSRIRVQFPSGTDTTMAGAAVIDTTAAPGTPIGFCRSTSVNVVSCSLSANRSIAGGHSVRLVVNRVANPEAGAKHLGVSTTSDTGAASPDYTIVGAHQITQPAVTPSPAVPHADPASYTITFKVSATGALSSAAGSQINVVFQMTGVDHAASGEVYDRTVAPGTQIGDCGFDGARGVTCGLFSGRAIAAGHAVRVVVNGLENPGTGGYVLEASTTSDVPSRASSQYAIGGRPSVSGLSPASGPAAGGTTVTISGANFTGATSVRFGSAEAVFNVNGDAQITALSPPGSGTVDVTVTSPDGTSATGAADRFTYSEPAGAQTATGTQASSETLSPATGAPTFTPVAPNVTGMRSATLSTAVNPHGLPTTVHFEYGLDPELTGAPLDYDHRTSGRSLDGDFTDHAVTENLANLLTNATYHVRVVATNSAGTVNGVDHVFTTKADPAPKAAVLGEKLVGAVTEGVVLIKLPGALARQAGGGAGFVPLTQARNLPVGTVVDARRGTINLVAATGTKGKTQSGRFGGAVFKISQSRDKRKKGLTEVRLRNSVFKGAPSFTACKTGAKRKIVQRLRADVKGAFRTRGKYATATARGARWDMTDRCDGTLTAVKRGKAVVRNVRRKKDHVVRAGKSYLAKAP